MLKVLGIVGGILAAAAAVGLGIFTGATLAAPDETRIADVVRIAQGPMPDTADVATHRTVSGIRFPDWSKQGWSARDGQGTRFANGRIAATVRYRRGAEQAAMTIVSGTEEVDIHDGSFRVISPKAGSGDPELTLYGWSAAGTSIAGCDWCDDARLLSRVVVVKRLERGRSVVLTGWPTSKGLEQRLTALALAPLPPA